MLRQSWALRLKLSGSAVIALASLALPAQSRPYPDRTGICYFFEGETQALTEPCVISSGYGAGAHYAILQWSDGVKTRVFMINRCLQGDFDASGFCDYTVDDHAAEPYSRNVFMQVTTAVDEDSLSCFRVLETGNSVCYRFN